MSHHPDTDQYTRVIGPQGQNQVDPETLHQLRSIDHAHTPTPTPAPRASARVMGAARVEFTPEAVAEISHRYRDGQSTTDLAESYGVAVLDIARALYDVDAWTTTASDEGTDDVDERDCCGDDL